MSELKNRIDFVYIFDVQDGNPNGDPDAGNLPRVDAETGMGLVTDVCLKRKVRNYVQVAKQLAPGYDIFIKEKAVLNTLIDGAHEDESVKNAEEKDKANAARDIMCQKYYDIRTFGALMTTGKNAGQVRGPIQMTFARSVDPITALEHSITRMAVCLFFLPSSLKTLCLPLDPEDIFLLYFLLSFGKFYTLRFSHDSL